MGAADRFATLEKVRLLGSKAAFRKKRVTLDEFVLSETPLAQIRDANGRSREDLEREFPLIWQTDDYARRLLDIGP